MKSRKNRLASAMLCAALLTLPACALAGETAPLTLSTQQDVQFTPRREDAGQLDEFGRRRAYLGVSAYDGWLYQARIGGLPVGPGFITEWLFNAVTFDGFASGECLLKEAKAKYDQFFDEFGYRRDFWKGDTTLLAQAVAQSSVAMPQPPVQLRWYFMQPMSYRYFSKMFSSAKLRIETVFQP